MIVGMLFVAGCNPLGRPSLAPYAEIVAHPPRQPTDLDLRFLGASSISFADGENSILTDGFFTRPNAWTLAFGHLVPEDGRVEFALKEVGHLRPNLILVAHSHHDHAMDAARVATLTGAAVARSRSAANLVRSSLPAGADVRSVKNGDQVEAGRFRVSVFETPDSPRPLFPDSIDRSDAMPSPTLRDFRAGENLSFLVEHGARRILVVPSANFIPGRLRNVRADVAFLGIGTLGNQDDAFIEEYWNETVRPSCARLVVPIHWDDFTRPLDKPRVPLPRAADRFDRSMRRLLELACRDGVRIVLPVAFAPLDLDAPPTAEQLEDRACEGVAL